MSYTLDGNALGNIQSEAHSLRADIQEMPMPASPSNETLGFDFNGVVRTITLAGKQVFTTTANMMDWIDTIESLMNGAQIGVTFHSDRYDAQTSGSYTDGNFTVMVTAFNPNFLIGEEILCTYTLTLLEAHS